MAEPAARLPRRPVALAVAALAPLAVVGLLVAAPGLDVRWQNQPAHFWIVLVAALVSLVLAYAVSAAARRRRDARLFLIGLAFMASAGLPRPPRPRQAGRAARQEHGVRAGDTRRARGRGRARGHLGE
jgi:hypothetical protein